MYIFDFMSTKKVFSKSIRGHYNKVCELAFSFIKTRKNSIHVFTYSFIYSVISNSFVKKFVCKGGFGTPGTFIILHNGITVLQMD